MNRLRLACLALVLVTLGACPKSLAQAALPGGPSPLASTYVVADGSRFWIEGRTPLAPFTCVADQVGGYGRVVGAAEAGLDAEVAVPVRAFECGVRQMSHDLYDALRGRAHPAVRLVLDDVERLGPAEAGWTPLRVRGTLSLAGVTRTVSLLAEGQLTPGGRVRLRGRHALRMTDFGITPPAGPLGLIRADDRIAVRFELLAAPRPR